MRPPSPHGPIPYYLYPSTYLSHFRVPPFRRWLLANHDSMAGQLPDLDGGRVLEVGCGPGIFTRRLAAAYPDARILGVDQSEGMIRQAGQPPVPPNVWFRVADFRDVEGRHDVVVSSGCWEFFTLDEGVALLDGVLRADGVAIVNTIGPTAWARAHQAFFAVAFRARVRLFAVDALRDALHRAGFATRWEPVNPGEGTYTVVCWRPSERDEPRPRSSQRSAHSSGIPS